MREIKFRAWDKEQGRMSKVKMLDFRQWIVGDEFDYERNSFSNQGTDRHLLMQYTGLKDKNGKEIYEGDIYRQEVWMFGASEGFHTGEIVYDTSRFCVKYPWGASVLRFTGEVIGNIYSDKELLD